MLTIKVTRRVQPTLVTPESEAAFQTYPPRIQALFRSNTFVGLSPNALELAVTNALRPRGLGERFVHAMWLVFAPNVLSRREKKFIEFAKRQQIQDRGTIKKIFTDVLAGGELKENAIKLGAKVVSNNDGTSVISYQRFYLKLEQAGDGGVTNAFSLFFPNKSEPSVVFKEDKVSMIDDDLKLLRGVLPDGLFKMIQPQAQPRAPSAT